jgi:sugar-specific transcriptional regulator TrmB/DNA-binding CsgD family transcriptional regulator
VAERLYLSLIDRHPLTAGELAGATDASPTGVRASIARLESLGLVARTPGKPPRYQPTPPAVSLESLVLQRQREVAAAGQAAQALQKSFAAHNREASEVIEVVTAPEQIQQRYLQMQNSAKDEILNFDGPPYSHEPMEYDVELERLAAGIKYRVIYCREALEVPGRLDAINQRCEAGEQARCLTSIPIKLVIADRRSALLPLQVGHSEALTAAIVVHESSLLDMLVLVFEEHWRRATALRTELSEASATGRAQVSRTEQIILGLLSAGQKDEAVARQLGVTVRTVRRHVHELCERFGCHSRFQLALQAQHRGLV